MNDDDDDYECADDAMIVESAVDVQLVCDVDIPRARDIVSFTFVLAPQMLLTLVADERSTDDDDD